jgi:hypothetical protein
MSWNKGNNPKNMHGATIKKEIYHDYDYDDDNNNNQYTIKYTN